MGIIKKNRVRPSADETIPSGGYDKEHTSIPSTFEVDDPQRDDEEITDNTMDIEDREDTFQEEDVWDLDAFLAGELPDRRQSNERRTEHRREADLNLISTAEDEAEAIQRYAYEEGYTQALQQAEADILELKQCFTELTYGKEEALNDMIKQVGPLAIAAAEKILKVEIACDEMLVDRLVRDTIQKAGKDNKTILIKVHPSDVSTLRQSLKEEPIANLDAELTILDDKDVEPGSCVVETNSGLIDANFKTQLALLKKLIG